MADIQGKRKESPGDSLVLWRLVRNVHAGNKSIAKFVRMVDGRVDQEVASGIVDNLVHHDNPAALLVGLNAEWFDVRIQGNELTCPIVTHLVLSMDVAALPAVRPFHFGVHPRDYRLNVTGIEIAIGGGQNLTLGHGWVRFYSG